MTDLPRTGMALPANAENTARSAHLFRTIAATHEALMADLDGPALMRHICDVLVEDGHFRMAWIGMIEADGVRIRPAAAAGFNNDYLSRADIRCDDSPQGQGPTGTAIRLGRTVVNGDTETNPQFALWRDRARDQGYRSSAATPIQVSERCVGALNLYSDKPYAFGPDETTLLEKLAADLGAVLARRATETALRESEERFRLLLDHSPEAIYGVDTNGICTFVNPACLRMLGYTRDDDMIGKNLHELIHHSHQDGSPYPREHCNVRLSTLEGKSTHVENEVHWRADGSCFPVEYWSHPIYRKGELVGAVVTCLDITERKRAEQLLKQSEERYRQISSVTTDLLYSCTRNAEGTFVVDWMAGGVERVFGYSLEAVLECGCWCGFVHPDDIAIFDRNITQLQPGQTSECELRIIAQDGSIRYLHAYSKVVAESATVPGDRHRLYGACQDVTLRRQAEERIEFLAHHDALTGLPNRILLRDRFEQALAFAERAQSHVALLFLDLDNFKIVNDTLGHAAGDQLLQAVVARLNRSMRDTDTVSRQGGDEFILLLNEIPDPKTVERIANDILAQLSEPVEIDGHVLNTSCSIGISFYPDDGRDFNTLLQRADVAMYNAKESGRNTFRFFNPAMNLRANEHLLLQNRLHQALEKNEFSLHYQPQLDIGTDTVIGVEALLRWHNPDLGQVPPSRFIPVAEDSGLIIAIGDWVLQEACRQMAQWLKAGLPELTLSVNLSALQFRRANLVDSVAAALERSGLPARLLELELTESILLQDIDNTLHTVRQLKALGVQLSIDDFGTGYSSLSYLKRFAVDKLKIDQSFVRDIGSDPDDAAIVRAIIQLAKSLRLGIIAEGVESAEQLGFLRLEGCREIQGYLFSRPLPATLLEGFIRARLGSGAVNIAGGV
jgi:diguanylate cyclase (GGDEF)-like protein/PAS domain S-box-containing protein